MVDVLDSVFVGFRCVDVGECGGGVLNLTCHDFHSVSFGGVGGDTGDSTDGDGKSFVTPTLTSSSFVFSSSSVSLPTIECQRFVTDHILSFLLLKIK